jgi:hypothetical protein
MDLAFAYIQFHNKWILPLSGVFGLSAFMCKLTSTPDDCSQPVILSKLFTESLASGCCIFIITYLYPFTVIVSGYKHIRKK